MILGADFVAGLRKDMTKSRQSDKKAFCINSKKNNRVLGSSQRLEKVCIRYDLMTRESSLSIKRAKNVGCPKGVHGDIILRLQMRPNYTTRLNNVQL
ncbi:hypothetical protein Lwal_2030 [Legionella waltersii]|uniref:Uncharacterized protein n=1 Tax=Legionella waltersii TaxID=66969 RepID=A0A0W1A4Q4_9GAMM|nr:hypothetical protein Lwal_2030 [Legionella waltersii]SNV13604.1 Uncharacterised protein [Legionella waltersii]